MSQLSRDELAAALTEAGAAHIFGPGTVIADAAVELLNDLKGRLGH